MHVDFCWSVVMYTPHIAWLWDINVCHIFYNIFSIIIFQICYAPPPKKPSKLRFLRWHHLSIISQLAFLEQKTMVCLFPSTDNLFTIALHFHSMAVHKHAYTISTCYVRNAKTTSGKERLWWAFVGKHAMLLWSSSQLVGKRIPMSFVPNTLADWWLTDDVISRIWVWKVF